MVRHNSPKGRGAVRAVLNGACIAIAIGSAVTLLSATTPRVEAVTDLSAALGPQVSVETIRN